MTRRGPEYADQLSAVERRTLDALVAEVGRRSAGRRPEWRTPVGAGLAALVVVLVAAMLTQAGWSRLAADTPAASGTASQGSPAAAFLDLAAAAAAVPPPAAGRADIAYQHRLDVTVSPMDGPPGYCRAGALTLKTWQLVDQVGRPGAPFVRLAVEGAEPPPAALTGCGTVVEAPVPGSLPLRADVGRRELFVIWDELDQVLGSRAHRYVPLWIVDPQSAVTPAPRPLDDLAAADRSPYEWWPRLVRLLASPQPEPEVVALALELAAGRAVDAPDGTVALLGPGTDVTGRPGIRVKVPYTVDGERSTAELTFDPDTGSLRQSVVETGAGTEITTFLAVRMIPDW